MHRVLSPPNSAPPRLRHPAYPPRQPPPRPFPLPSPPQALFLVHPTLKTRLAFAFLGVVLWGWLSSWPWPPAKGEGGGSPPSHLEL